MNEKFLKVQSLYNLLELEPLLILGCLIGINWIFYKVFLKEVNEERHKNIQNHFKTLLRWYFFLSSMFLVFSFCQSVENQWSNLNRITPYLALVTFFGGNVVFIKCCRLLILQYLFLGSMRHGVPLLIVNIFTLILSMILLVWSSTVIFGLQLGPLLATSAAASVILGLALQDTLGNLFAGISLQVDHNFEIGDWLEITAGSQKTIGQVKEISWRSVSLLGFSDELITLPNRFMAGATIANFSPPDSPICRRQIFRIAHGENIELAKQVIERAVAGISEIRGIPGPFALVSDSTENWIEIKIIYFIDNYSSQFNILDKVYTRGIKELSANGLKLARQVIEVSGTTPVYEHN
jgi:small-conductance mechanosensitive channel